MARKVSTPILFDQETIDKLDEYLNNNRDKYTSRSDVVRDAVNQFLSTAPQK